MTQTRLVLLDVNETLSDLTPIADTFAEQGLPRDAAPLWFAATLRDGFALTATGQTAPFATLAGDGLRDLIAARGLDVDPEAAVAAVLGAFSQLPLHSDVVPGLQAMTEAGLRPVTLSNGSADVAESLLAKAGARELVAEVLSVADAGIWKPATSSYRWAVARCGVSLDETAMVAVHPWDLQGAQQAGLRTVWVDRQHRVWPSAYPEPDVHVTSFADVAEALSR